MTLPPLFILRHGETEWNVAERLQGRLDSPLTQLGLRQAGMQRVLLTEGLPPAAVALSSPSPRALRTAEIALQDRPITCDERLMEVDLGDWTGRTLAQIRALRPDPTAGGDPHLWKFHAPRGERLAGMVTRCTALLADLTGPTVIVTHDITSRVLRCVALGLPPEALSQVPGGQGVVHRIENGRAEMLSRLD